MNTDFDLVGAIYLRQSAFHLDLHNDYDFVSLEYSVELRTLQMRWRRSRRDGVRLDLPLSVQIAFAEVTELRIYPRNAARPFTEDDCLSSFGYWTDERWSEGGLIVMEPGRDPEPEWLTGFEFMSGAIVAVHAFSAQAHIEA